MTGTLVFGVNPRLAMTALPGFAARDLLMPARLGVTGKAARPPLFETMDVLGCEVFRRLRRAIEVLRQLR